MSRLRSASSALFAAFSLRDLTLYAGLGLAAYGFYQIFPPAAFIVPGAVLIYVAVFGVA